MKKLIFKFNLICAIAILGLGLAGSALAYTGGGESNVWGHAWSENIGWVDFGCNNGPGGPSTRVNDCATTANYGVSIDEITGELSGYAWSENIGWISFNEEDQGSYCPVGSCGAEIDPDTAEVSGWGLVLMTKRYEYHTVQAGVGSAITDLKGQTFTVGTTGDNEFFRPSSVKILAFRDGLPGTTNVKIMNTSLGVPGNITYCSGTINADSFTTNSVNGGEWYEITLRGNDCFLQAGDQYALVIEPVGADNDNKIVWSYNPDDNTYSGGKAYWFGGTWNAMNLADFKFEIYGSPMKNWVRLGLPGSGGISHWDLVDDVTPDYNSTYVYNNSFTEQKDAYSLSNPTGITGTETINRIRTRARFFGDISFYFRLNGTESSSFGTMSAQFNPQSETNWPLGSSFWSPSKPGGGSWTWSDINNLQTAVGIKGYNLSGTSLPGKITQVYLEVEYISSGGDISIVTLRPDADGDYTNIEGQSTGPPGYSIFLDSSTYDGTPNGYSEFEGWGWGGSKISNGEAIVGWLSFNRSNCDPDGDGQSNGLGACPPAGTPISDYSVKTSLDLDTNRPPDAVISSQVVGKDPLNPADDLSLIAGRYEVYSREGINLINRSTDPDSTNPPANNNDIVQTEWFIDGASQGVSAGSVVNHVPAPSYLSSGPTFTDRNVDFIVTDTEGETDTASFSYRVKRDISADFACSVDGADWKACDDPTLTFTNGAIIYLRDNNANPPDHYSVASYGSSINSRAWSLNGAPVCSGGTTCDDALFATSGTDICLVVTDLAGRISDNTCYSLTGRMPLPKWREVRP